MKAKEKAKEILCIIMSAIIVVFASFCVATRINAGFDVPYKTALIAAGLCMPDGDVIKSDTSHDYAKKTNSVQKPKTAENPVSVKATSSEISQNDYLDSNEKTYPILEKTITAGDISYKNISIKNISSYTPDVEQLLSESLDFKLDKTHEAQVLIVHTHTLESFMPSDSGYYSEDYYPRTTDNSKNVVRVGDAITESLKKHGIGVVHNSTQHDLTYDGAYGRCYSTIESMLDRYQGIKVVLDIHRDSMTTDDMTKIKPTFTYQGKKSAQIMIMAGHDDGSGDFPTWRENLKFALQLQTTAEQMYPGITRPLYLGDFTYNMNVNSGSLLIEVGTDANTLDEAVSTGEMLGNVLSKVLQNSQ